METKLRGSPYQRYFTTQELKENPEIQELLENPEEGNGSDIQLLKILHQVKVTKTDLEVNIHEKNKKIEDTLTRDKIIRELKKIIDLLTN